MNIQPQTTDKDRLIMTFEEEAQLLSELHEMLSQGRRPVPARVTELHDRLRERRLALLGQPVSQLAEAPEAEMPRADKAVVMYSGLWTELNAINGLITDLERRRDDIKARQRFLANRIVSDRVAEMTAGREQ